MLKTTRFLGLDCVELDNTALSLLVTQSTGPRVLRLRLHGKESPFAEVPDFSLEHPGGGRFHVWGGHRLWHAPEMARRTYLPDDAPPEIEEVAGGLVVSQPVEVATGLQKSLRITLPPDAAVVVVDHILANRGLWPVRSAPWAITQLRPGGVAILPQGRTAAGAEGLLPNRQLALWPYTDVRSPHLEWGNDHILVHASLRRGALKLGFPNPRGWLAYHWRDGLLVKWARFEPGKEYFDLGSSSECYCNDRFLELETMGPACTIGPEESVRHREVWQLYDGVSFSPEEGAIRALVEAYGLDEGAPYL
jgi:hypothetical protein